MSRSLHALRRGLLGLAFAGALAFGATAALAEPEQPSRIICPPGYQPCECGECVEFNEPCGPC